jgi:hypothetical protein
MQDRHNSYRVDGLIGLGGSRRDDSWEKEIRSRLTVFPKRLQCVAGLLTEKLAERFWTVKIEKKQIEG